MFCPLRIQPIPLMKSKFLLHGVMYRIWHEVYGVEQTTTSNKRVGQRYISDWCETTGGCDETPALPNVLLQCIAKQRTEGVQY